MKNGQSFFVVKSAINTVIIGMQPLVDTNALRIIVTFDVIGVMMKMN